MIYGMKSKMTWSQSGNWLKKLNAETRLIHISGLMDEDERKTSHLFFLHCQHTRRRNTKSIFVARFSPQYCVIVISRGYGDQQILTWHLNDVPPKRSHAHRCSEKSRKHSGAPTLSRAAFQRVMELQVSKVWRRTLLVLVSAMRS
jgi:hypothetical protein